MENIRITYMVGIMGIHSYAYTIPVFLSGHSKWI